MNSREQKAEEFYTYIGKFAVEFEAICFVMESGIRGILYREGLKNDQIQEILLAGLTAEPLSALYRSLCGEFLQPNQIETEIIKYSFKLFQELISIRNDVLHGKWAIFTRGKDDNPQGIAIGHKLHKNAKGKATKTFFHDITEFQKLIKKARDCSGCISKITNCISGDYPLEKNFNKIGKGKFEPLNEFCKK